MPFFDDLDVLHIQCIIYFFDCKFNAAFWEFSCQSGKRLSLFVICCKTIF